jgi:hypothetical protein
MSTLLGPPIGYVDLLDAHIADKLEKEAQQGRSSNPLRPSSAGKCTRELAYEFAEYRGLAKYEKESMSPATHRLLNLGHSIEWNILKMFEDLEVFDVKYRQQVVSFFKLTEEQWIEGSIDAVFWSPKWKAVIDIKSKGNKYSSWSSSQWDEHSEKYGSLKSVERITEQMFWIPDLEAFLEEVNDPFLAANFYQLNLYANTEFLKERGIDHAAVIQYNKNDSRIRELRFAPSAKVYDRVREKFHSVATMVDQPGGTPEMLRRDYALGSIKCAFCSFKRECWPEADALKEYFKTWPKKNWPDDTNRLGEVGEELERLFERYTQAENSEKEKKRIESLITLIMNEEQLQKIRLNDKRVYEMKALKTDGLVIRRSKV